ncbi:MAG: hypothetical protein AB7K37_09965 [Cyclobacteriaceae bacterium]
MIDRERITWLVLFSIAMGFLETSVVVYLRELYYPEGFDFPLQVMDMNVAVVELLREASTIIMLAGIGYFTGRTFSVRFASFIACFAIWDIFYYVFLKLLLDWPESLFTWDILFLIPSPWIGPVLAPCLVSLTMLLLAAVIYWRDHQGATTRIQWIEWLILAVGSVVIVASWTIDYLQYHSGLNKMGNDPMYAFASYVPDDYNWWVFALGEIILIVAIIRFWRRTGNQINTAGTSSAA